MRDFRSIGIFVIVIAVNAAVLSKLGFGLLTIPMLVTTLLLALRGDARPVMNPALFIGVLGAAILCIVAAFRMAIRRGRHPRAWMWAAVFFGPLPLVLLVLLPHREPARG